MRRRIFVLWATLLAAGLAFTGVAEAATGVPPVIEWEKTFGGSGNDYAHAIQQTADGGYIMVG
ncbi:MAG: hypothetical protein LBQ42_14035, partial [Synergistaceae bacterium]|nr:hypothetical protein [Synergistaceae bacterium]